MSNKNPKHKKKISEEDLKKHLDERNKNVVEKDNTPTFKPKKKVEDQVVKKDTNTNINRNKKGEVVIKDEEGIYRPIEKKQQPEIVQGGKPKSGTQIVIENKQKQAEAKKKILKPLDVTTDVMQLGNFAPNPYAQAIGKIGNVAGGLIDAYQTYDALSEEDYVSAAINAASLALPFGLGSQTFRRNSKYLKPGQLLYPLSSQAGIFPGGYSGLKHSTTQYIEPFTKVRGMTDTSLLANRALLGTLGAETVYDTQYSMGGNLKQQTNNNMLNEFNEGGTHEQNPLGGIPQGTGNNGQMNTVEQGETKKDSFIYSNRITLTPQVIAQFNLPKSLSGKTAADATKLINNKFEGRNSKIDNNTKKAFLDRIAEAQETVKAEEQAKIQEAMQINSTEVPDMMNGQIPQGMEEYTQPQQPMAYGGKMSQNQMLFGGNSQQGQMAGNMTGQVATTAADMFFPGSGQFLKMGDQFGTQIGNMIGGDKGEQIGGLISPMGTLKGIGTSIATGNINDIPGIGLFGGKTTKQKEIQKMKFNKDIFESNSKISDFKYGGNMYEDGGSYETSSASYDPTKINLGLPKITNKQFLDNLNYVKNINDQDLTILSPEQLQESNSYSNPENTPSRMFGPQPTGHYEGEMYDGSKLGKIASKVGQYAKDNYGNALRYAPVGMNAYQLAKIGRPEVETLDRLNNRYNPQYMDEKALTNQINAETNYTANALANAANGSLGSLSNNILGMQLNKTKALSDAYSKVADVNRNEDKTAQQFNLGVDQVNIGQSNMEKDINAKNRGAFKTEKSRLLGQMGTDLGNIGKETVYKKLAKEAFGYTYDGEYVRDDKGKVVNNPDTGKPLTKEELEKTKKYAQTFNTLGKREFGSLSLNNQNTKE